VRYVVLLLLLLMCPLTANAQAEEKERPWAAGVSAENQEQALELFRTGNEAFAHNDYLEAARLYREALAAWDHPAIHGNLAVALVHLDQPVEAYAELGNALAYGAAPFGENQHAQLVTSQKLLEGQLGRVEVECDSPGAVVTLNGETLLVGKGQVSRVVRAGQHQLVARKSEHLTFTSQIVALPEKPVSIRVVLLPLSEAGGYERRMPTWVPWVTLGVGAGVLATGAAFQLAASDNLDAYEQEIARECPGGCRSEDLPQAVRALEDRGKWQNVVGVSAMAVGGVALAGGALLLILNQPQHVRLEESGRRVGFVPTRGGGVFGLSGRF
jgi:hypothetical protein